MSVDQPKTTDRERAEWLSERAGLHRRYHAKAREEWIADCIEIFEHIRDTEFATQAYERALKRDD